MTVDLQITKKRINSPLTLSRQFWLCRKNLMPPVLVSSKPLTRSFSRNRLCLALDPSHQLDPQTQAFSVPHIQIKKPATHPFIITTPSTHQAKPLLSLRLLHRSEKLAFLNLVEASHLNYLRAPSPHLLTHSVTFPFLPANNYPICPSHTHNPVGFSMPDLLLIILPVSTLYQKGPIQPLPRLHKTTTQLFDKPFTPY